MEAAANLRQGETRCDSMTEQLAADMRTGETGITLWNPSGVLSAAVAQIRLPFPVRLEDGPEVQWISCDKEGFVGLMNLDPIPPFGCRIFHPGEKVSMAAPQIAETNVLENSLWRICFDENGEIRELYDKSADRQVLRGRGNVLSAHVDRGGYFESWNITPDAERKVFILKEVDEMSLVEDGPVRKTLRIRKRFRHSVIDQHISIYEKLPRIDFRTKADFREQQMLLKAGFQVDVDAPAATYDISMGNIKRPTTRNTSFEKAMFEVCMHKFMDLSSDDYGVAILNDCKYGGDV